MMVTTRGNIIQNDNYPQEPESVNVVLYRVCKCVVNLKNSNLCKIRKASNASLLMTI